MDELKQEILDKLLILMNVEQLTPKQALLFDININEMLAYCNRTELTEGVVNVFADVLSNSLSSTSTTLDAGAIQSYKEGDLQITYATGTDTSVKYSGKLEPYKKIRGISIV